MPSVRIDYQSEVIFRHAVVHFPPRGGGLCIFRYMGLIDRQMTSTKFYVIESQRLCHYFARRKPEHIIQHA